VVLTMSRSNNLAHLTMLMRMSSRGPIASRAPLLSDDRSKEDRSKEDRTKDDRSKEDRTGDGSIDALSYECVSIHIVMWSTL